MAAMGLEVEAKVMVVLMVVAWAEVVVVRAVRAEGVTAVAEAEVRVEVVVMRAGVEVRAEGVTEAVVWAAEKKVGKAPRFEQRRWRPLS